MANKHMKRRSVPLSIKEIQVKSMIGTTAYPLESLKVNKQTKKNLKIPSPSESAEQLEISSAAVRNAKWHCHSGK